MGYNSDYVKVEDTKNLFRVNNCQVRSVERTTLQAGKALFTKPMNKFSPNPRYFKSKMRKEQKKVLNFTRGYFSTSSVKAPAALDDAVKKNPVPGKVSARSSLKKDDDDVNKNAEGKKKETDNDDEKNGNDNVKQEEKEDKETEAEEKKESRTKRKEVKLFRKFEIEI